MTARSQQGVLSSDERVPDVRLEELAQRGVPDGLAPHDFGPIVRELQARRSQVKELKRLLRYATEYSSAAKLFSDGFLEDAAEALK